jgi:hypothetical protein
VYVRTKRAKLELYLLMVITVLHHHYTAMNVNSYKINIVYCGFNWNLVHRFELTDVNFLQSW